MALALKHAVERAVMRAHYEVHPPPPAVYPPPDPQTPGLTKRDVAEIRKLGAAGMPIGKIALKTHRAPQTIRRYLFLGGVS